jgi:membrane protein YqaA with SNARE-associated domain
LPKGDFIRDSKASYKRFERKGGIKFVRKSFVRLMAVLTVFALFFMLLSHFVLTPELQDWIKTELSPFWLLGTLFLSESFSGILPPDLYIWAVRSYPQHYFWVFLLALSSYTGGIVSYYIGTQLYKLPRVKLWVEDRYAEQFAQLKKYGGVLIPIAALTPLPYSPVSVVAGVVHYPFKWYLLVGVTRFARFFLYAWWIYSTTSLV